MGFLPTLRGQRKDLLPAPQLSPRIPAYPVPPGMVGRPYRPDWDLQRAVEFGLQQNIWVYRCVNTIANAAARLPMVMRQGNPIDGPYVDHPMLDLFNFQSSPYESALIFRKRISQVLLLNKQGVMIEVVRNRVGGVAALYILPPGFSWPIPSEQTFVSAYRTQYPGKGYFDVPAENVIWIREPHPTDPYSGQTPLEAAGLSIETDYYARLMNRNFLMNDGRPGGLLLVNGEIDETAAAQLRQRFYGPQGWGPGGAGRISVMEAEGAQWVDTSTSARDAQYAELKEITKNEILECLVPGTSIVTKRGVVAIEDVRVGDEVVTHRGRWRRVTQTICHETHDRVYEVTAKGFDPIRVTGNHPFHVGHLHRDQKGRFSRVDYEWVRTDDLRAYRVGPGSRWHGATIPQLDFNGGGCVRLSEHLTLGKRGNFAAWEEGGVLRHSSPRVQDFPAELKLTEGVGRLLGYYLAEGSVQYNKSVPSTIKWTFSDQEDDFVEDVQTLLGEQFGLESIIRRSPEKHSQSVYTASIFLAGLFDVGRSWEKVVPEWAWDGEEEFFVGLLEGWIRGDGTISKPRGGRRSRQVGNTTSPHLAWQMRLIAISLGLVAGHSVTVNRLPSSIRGVPVDIERRHPMHYIGWGSGERSPYRIVQGHFSGPVKSVVPVDYVGVVYNLEVEEDNSFLTTGGMVHNCFGVPESIAGMAANRTFANASEEGLVFWEETMLAHLDTLAKALDALDPNPRMYLGYDLTRVRALQIAENQQKQMMLQEVQANTVAVDEYRIKTGRQPVGGGAAKLRAPAMLVEVADVSAALQPDRDANPNAFEPSLVETAYAGAIEAKSHDKPITLSVEMPESMRDQAALLAPQAEGRSVRLKVCDLGTVNDWNPLDLVDLERVIGEFCHAEAKSIADLTSGRLVVGADGHLGLAESSGLLALRQRLMVRLAGEGLVFRSEGDAA